MSLASELLDATVKHIQKPKNRKIIGDYFFGRVKIVAQHKRGFLVIHGWPHTRLGKRFRSARRAVEFALGLSK